MLEQNAKKQQSMGTRYLHTYSQCITPHELTFWFQHMTDVFKTTLFWWGCQGLFAGWWFSEGIPLINLTQKYKLRYICIWCQTPTNPWGSLISSTSKKYWLPKLKERKIYCHDIHVHVLVTEIE